MVVIGGEWLPMQQQSPTFGSRTGRRRGMVAVLAMVFLVLFSALAIGMFEVGTTQLQVGDNNVRISRALRASESGMQFARWQLAQFTVPATTTQSQLLSLAATQLQAQLNGTRNLGTMTVGYQAGGTSISIPSLPSQYISYDDTGSGFRLDITQSGSELVVKTTGHDSSGVTIARAVQLNYLVAQNPSTIFNYGMATNGALTLSGGVLKGIPDASRGSFYSGATGTSTPLSMSGSATVSGQVYFTNPSGAISGSGSVSGTTNTALWGQYVHNGVPAPEFPSIDPSPFVDYMNSVTMTMIIGSTSATPLSNIRILAGTNPTFSGGGTINGLIYIETPNKVTFSGGTHVTGVIVVDNPNDTTSTNSITFSGGGVMQGPENLPSSYGALTTMTGAAILAPNFALTLTGGSATFGGSVFVKSVALSGGSGGSVNGSVIAYGASSTTFSGGSGFTFTNTGPTAIPTAGVRFSGQFKPRSDSYKEPHP